MTTEAQQLLDAAFAGTLNLDADASQANAPTATDSEAGNPANNTPAPAAGAQATQDDEKPAPIASKSGEYTIPYEKLTQARQERDSFRAENEQLKATLAQLTSAQNQNLATAQHGAQARADAGQAPTQADKNLAIAQEAAAQGVDVSLFGDFSEEGIAKGVAALVDSKVNAIVEERLQKALAPLQQREAKTAADEHSGAIYQAHPDADSIVESAEFGAWMDGLPSFSRAAVAGVLDPKTGGTAEQVIEVFTAFKDATRKAPAAADPAKAAIEQAKARATNQPPTSLSELPGAPAANGDAERMTALAGNPAALLDFMAGLSPEKQNRLMNSVV